MFDTKEMFGCACTYAYCAETCKKYGEYDIIDYWTPSIVNSAFACEVFLKALLVHHSIDFQRKHELKLLFDLLPSKCQEEIVTLTLRKSWKWHDGYGREKLELISKAFEDWRYYYENKQSYMSCDISFLESFRNALREECAKEIWGMTWLDYDNWIRTLIKNGRGEELCQKKNQ